MITKEDFLLHFNYPEIHVLNAIIDFIHENAGIPFHVMYMEGIEDDDQYDLAVYGFDDDKARRFAKENAFDIQLLINQSHYELRGFYLIEEDPERYAWFLCGKAFECLLHCIDAIKDDED